MICFNKLIHIYLQTNKIIIYLTNLILQCLLLIFLIQQYKVIIIFFHNQTILIIYFLKIYLVTIKIQTYSISNNQTIIFFKVKTFFKIQIFFKMLNHK